MIASVKGDYCLSKFKHLKTSIVLAREDIENLTALRRYFANETGDFLNSSAVIRKALAIARAQMGVKP